jgi:hypothetical protein
VRSGAVDLIVIDSVAALVPKAELEGDMGDQHMGLQARLMSQALRKLTAAAHRNNTCIVFINQLRMKIGVMFGNPETTTGGNALKFYASVRLDVRRIGSLKSGDEVQGSRTRVKVVKNKLAPPFREAEFDVRYGQGIDAVAEVLDAGVERGVIERAGHAHLVRRRAPRQRARARPTTRSAADYQGLYRRGPGRRQRHQRNLRPQRHHRLREEGHQLSTARPERRREGRVRVDHRPDVFTGPVNRKVQRVLREGLSPPGELLARRVGDQQVLRADDGLVRRARGAEVALRRGLRRGVAVVIGHPTPGHEVPARPDDLLPSPRLHHSSW